MHKSVFVRVLKIVGKMQGWVGVFLPVSLSVNLKSFRRRNICHSIKEYTNNSHNFLCFTKKVIWEKLKFFKE